MQDQPKPFYGSRKWYAKPQRFLRRTWLDAIKARPIAWQVFLQRLARQYRYSTFGLLWIFLPSVLTAVLVSVGMRAGITGFAEVGVPAQVNAVFGILMMQTFLEGFNLQRVVLSENLDVFSKQKLPLEGYIASGLLIGALGSAVRLPILWVTLVIYNVDPLPTIALVPIGFLAILFFSAALGLLTAPWNALSRDLDGVMQFLPFLLFGISPVFLVPIPGSLLHKVFLLNPLTHLFESVRGWSYGHMMVDFQTVFVVMALTPLLFVLGWFFCRLSKPYVMERCLQ